MKKYLVYEVYSGCEGDSRIADTREEAEQIEQEMIALQIKTYGEEALAHGIGDYCTYIEEIEADSNED